MKQYKYKFENLELKECTNKALRCKSGMVFFFDENKIFRCIDLETAFERGIKGVHKCDDGSFRVIHFYYSDLFGRCNQVLAKKTLCKLQCGEHVSKLIDIAKTTEIEINYMDDEEKRKLHDDMYYFVTSIEKPNIYRDTDNKNTKTFDFVEVIVNISVYHKNQIEFAREHKKQIAKMVLRKIESDSQFQKFGVPISVLTLRNVTLSKNNFIRYLFELKSV